MEGNYWIYLFDFKNIRILSNLKSIRYKMVKFSIDQKRAIVVVIVIPNFPRENDYKWIQFSYFLMRL